jgi:hypothetical protein
MGLSAIVFKNVAQLENQFGTDLFDVDRTTGETFTKPDVRLGIPRPAFVAAKERLGNVDEVRFLRDTVERLLGTSASILTSRVLYSASHSGDVIGDEELPELRRELFALKAARCEELADFLQAMERLLLAVESEKNPIVFV